MFLKLKKKFWTALELCKKQANKWKAEILSCFSSKTEESNVYGRG